MKSKTSIFNTIKCDVRNIFPQFSFTDIYSDLLGVFVLTVLTFKKSNAHLSEECTNLICKNYVEYLMATLIFHSQSIVIFIQLSNYKLSTNATKNVLSYIYIDIKLYI